MRRRIDLVAAVVAAAVVGALGAAGPVHAEGGPIPPTPSPSALPSVPAVVPPSGAASPSSPALPSVAPTGTGGQVLGRVADDLIVPALAGVRIAAALVVELGRSRASGPTPPTTASPGGTEPPATTLQPGGGSSTDPGSWTPKAPVRVPSAPAPRAGGAAPTTKEEILWAAYESAARSQPACRIAPMLLAAIGEVESSSVRGRSLDARHDVVPPVIGPRLSGGSYARIHDSDGGQLDGDPVWDHAVGPMQFIPGTWRIWGADGNGDGVADPQNVEDATVAAARYLCAGGRDLSRAADLRAAVRSYNHSDRYVATVLGLYEAVTSGAVAGP